MRWTGFMWLLGACISGVVAILLATAAGADKGVGVNVGALDVETPLEPGRGYYLPKIGVINTGDEVTSYTMAIGFVDGQADQRPEAGWFSFTPDRFTLLPGQSRDVDVGVKLPTTAAAGDYFVLVKAQTTSEEGGQARVGIAAATKLSFSVEAAGWLDAQRSRLNRWLYEGSPWTYVLPGALFLVFLAVKFGRLPFRVRLERR
jgi:hypothetical protein